MKTIAVVIVVVVAGLCWQVVRSSETIPERELSFSQLLEEVKAAKIKKLVVYTSGEIIGESVDRSVQVRTMAPPNYTKHYDVFEQNSVDYLVRDDSIAWGALAVGAVIGSVVTILMIAGVQPFVRRRPRP